MLTLWLVCVCFLAAVWADYVDLPHGRLQGHLLLSRKGREIFSFQGIPYAKPPVGELRFQPPQPPEPWTDVLKATKEGPDCIQRPFPEAPTSPELVGDEDCLYLNVYTPQLPEAGGATELLPVMFWIHGGAWMAGSGSTDLYGPQYLLDKEIVLVTINYRLGPLGFLSTGDEVCPGNNGLKDQVAALRWVRDNIAAFGGNPDSVTIFGESAGGANVHYHVLSKASRGERSRFIIPFYLVLNDIISTTGLFSVEGLFKVCHGSLYAVMWLVDDPREFNLPTLPQKSITYVPEKLPNKHGVHSEEYYVRSTGFLNMCSHNVVSTGCNKSPLCILCYFKMNDVIDNPADCEVRSVIRFLNARHLKPAEIYRQLKEVYGDTVMNERNVRKWCEIFNNGRTNVHDETRAGRPSLITEDLKTKVNDRILQDRRTSFDELHIAFPDISRSLLGEIVSQHLGYHKICARWVPRQLSDQHKTQRMASSLTFLIRYHTDGDAFLDQIVTGDEILGVSQHPRDQAPIMSVTSSLITQETEKIQTDSLNTKSHGYCLLGSQRCSFAGFHAKRHYDQCKSLL
ncbi:hypothetical protein ANN_13642 [Periplaneta americana]|uniref:Carboxylic ester hydrolase n=1 Tax=Periplaneta americana TaxID=6978 RepID=A0ABQ8TNI0_PERAM|nr:hypothetical protein ANN_13642 [Periplaneta americana]